MVSHYDVQSYRLRLYLDSDLSESDADAIARHWRRPGGRPPWLLSWDLGDPSSPVVEVAAEDEERAAGRAEHALVDALAKLRAWEAEKRAESERILRDVAEGRRPAGRVDRAPDKGRN